MRVLWGGGGGTLNFVCYLGWAPGSSVYKKISADIADIRIPKKYSPCFLFIKVWFSFIFPV